MMTLQETINKIQPADPAVFGQCRVNWNNVAKPLYSLGIFEDMISKIGAAQDTDRPDIRKRRALVFCADNGVVEEGVSQSDHTVTTAVARSLSEGSSNVNIFAGVAGADVKVFDVGMVDDIDGPERCKVMNGTRNMTKGPAMTREEAIRAVEAGIHAAEQAKADGCGLVVIGEMGIGNTTSSTAILSVIIGTEPGEICGRGSGLSDEGLQKKIRALQTAISLNRPDRTDALDILSKVGGADIAAMCGVILAGAALHLPVVLDGLISGAAALLAYTFDPRTLDYMIPSHHSHEPGGSRVLQFLNLKAPIGAEMALGEGTGGVMLLPMLDMVIALYNGEHSFENIGIEAYK